MKNKYRNANCCSVNCFCWQNALIAKANRNKDFAQEDLALMRPEDDCHNLADQLEQAWNREIIQARKKRRQPSIFRAFCNAFRCRFLTFGLVGLISEMMMPLMMLTIKFIIEFLQDQSANYQQGIILFCMLTLFSLTFSYFRFQSAFGALKFILVIKKSTIGLLYRKLLKLSLRTIARTTSAKIINLASADISSLERTFESARYVVISPLIFVISMSIVGYLIGWQSVIVLACIIVLYAMLLICGSPIVKFRASASKATDIRLKMINELITGIRTIRSYAWEAPLMQKIVAARNLEIGRFTKLLCLRGVILGFTRYIGLLIFMPLVLIQVQNDEGLNPGDTYALYGLVLFMGYSSIAVFTFSLQSFLQFVAYMRRLGEVMRLVDFEPPIATVSNQQSERVRFDGVDATWGFQKQITESSKNLSNKVSNMAVLEKEDRKGQYEHESSKVLIENRGTPTEQEERRSVISDVNFTLQNGELMVVIGHVGSGKSSLLATIMKECELKKGKFSVNGRVAYVEQEPFILSETVEQNITLGRKLDQKRLKQVIRVCQLEPDLELFPQGVNTLIGEQGVNISGGQKARIALARALYADADIYLLDDPLSAVDPAVAQRIFSQCIQGYLRRKARILVTHQLHFTAGLEKLLLLNSNGTQEFYGHYDDLLNSKVTDIVKILESFQTSGADQQSKKRALSIFKRNPQLQDNIIAEDGECHSPMLRRMTTGTRFFTDKDQDQQLHEKGDNLIISEQKVHGAIKCKDYCFYFSNGCGCFMNAVGIFILVISLIIGGGFQLFLADWVAQSPANQRRSINIALCVMFVLLTLMIAIALSIALSLLILYIGKHLHNRMIKSVSRTPISFFDSNPTGRILNRFSKDIAVLDAQLTLLYFFTIGLSLQIILTVALSIYVLPMMAAVLVLLIILMLLFRRQVRIITTETLKWDGITRSPMNSLFSATIQGLMTIRAYSKQSYFIRKLESQIDENSRALFTFYAVIVSFGTKLNMLSSVYTILNIGCALLFKFYLDLDPVLLGMSITLTMELGNLFSFMVRNATEIENAMTSVQRIKEYVHLPQQAADWKPKDDELIESNWPQEGNIIFKNFTMRFRPEFEPVLSELNFVVNAGMKVGLVGRTGAGKSSLLQGLFRIVEKDSGLIEVDGQDISKIGLSTLRERMAIIPQSPFLFIGTIRENLDPFKIHSDSEIWQALEDVQLADFVRSSRCEAGIETVVSDASELFSVGQRQLVCLARAILRNAKILVMDEATANVDMETDELIQTTIRTRFRQCTVLTVAHRLATIMDSDRVLVLGKGRVLEYDRPYLLLVENKEDTQITNKEGHFAQMVLATGKQSADSLFKVAKESYNNYFF